MKTNLPKHVMEFWENGLKAKEQGHKEEAMTHFLVYYNLLTIFIQSYNTGYSKKTLNQRLIKIKEEISELVMDRVYLKTTTIPKEGIAEIQAAVGTSGNDVYQFYEKYDMLYAPIYVKRPKNDSLEIEQLTLIDYRKKGHENVRLLKLKVSCEEKIQEFIYDQEENSQMHLETIANKISESTGRDFREVIVNKTDMVIQITYPSLKELLKVYLVEGGWITYEEAKEIEIIGHPSKRKKYDFL